MCINHTELVCIGLKKKKFRPKTSLKLAPRALCGWGGCEKAEGNEKNYQTTDTRSPSTQIASSFSSSFWAKRFASSLNHQSTGHCTWNYSQKSQFFTQKCIHEHPRTTHPWVSGPSAVKMKIFLPKEQKQFGPILCPVIWPQGERIKFKGKI